MSALLSTLLHIVGAGFEIHVHGIYRSVKRIFFFFFFLRANQIAQNNKHNDDELVSYVVKAPVFDAKYT